MQLIGKITGIHGIKGEVSFSHHLKRSTRFDQWDCLMVELNPGSFIPFFIESIRSTTSDECICKLEEINDRDEARLIVNKPVYSSINYTIEEINTLSLKQYLGYLLHNDNTPIGEVVDTIESKHNSMLVIDYNGKEVLIPSQRDWIDRIEVKTKKIFMHLPEGLLEL